MSNEYADGIFKERRSRRRKRECSSQTDEEDLTDVHKHGGKQCLETMSLRLSDVEEKLKMTLTILPDLEGYNEKITQLEEKQNDMQRASSTPKQRLKIKNPN